MEKAGCKASYFKCPVRGDDCALVAVTFDLVGTEKSGFRENLDISAANILAKYGLGLVVVPGGPTADRPNFMFNGNRSVTIPCDLVHGVPCPEDIQCHRDVKRLNPGN